MENSKYKNRFILNGVNDLIRKPVDQKFVIAFMDDRKHFRIPIDYGESIFQAIQKFPV